MAGEVVVVVAALQGEVGVAVRDDEVEERGAQDLGQELSESGRCADSDEAVALDTEGFFAIYIHGHIWTFLWLRVLPMRIS